MNVNGNHICINSLELHKCYFSYLKLISLKYWLNINRKYFNNYAKYNKNSLYFSMLYH